MQINKKAWKNLAVDIYGKPYPDQINILNGAKILSKFLFKSIKYAEDGFIPLNEGKIFKLTKEEKNNILEVAILQYKGVSESGRKNKNIWKNIYDIWPRTAYRNYYLKQKYQDLWNTKDSWL